jgi:hypothetical protein
MASGSVHSVVPKGADLAGQPQGELFKVVAVVAVGGDEDLGAAAHGGAGGGTRAGMGVSAGRVGGSAARC